MIPRDWTHTFITKGGIKCKAYIGPYVWMYHQGRIDAIIVEDEKGCELRPPCNFDMATSTPKELVAFVESFPYPESDCKVCGYHMLAHASHYRTNDECDSCAKDRITEEYMEATKKERQLEALRDKRMLTKGFKWKLDAWVHPNRGDDYMITGYFVAKPTTLEITTILKKKGSRVFNDYSLTELKNGQ